LGGGTIYIS
jgi:hypothetical protein